MRIGGARGATLGAVYGYGDVRARRGVWGITLVVAAALLLALVPTASAALRGELDPTFGDGGKVLFGFGPTFANSSYWSVARQPDGGLVFAGRTESVQGKYIERAVLIQRRLPDGPLDPGFHQVVDGAGGYGPVGLALQSDGDILYSTGWEYGGSVKRLNPDGTPDTSYGKEGAATVPLRPLFLAVDSEGRTLVAGTAGIGGNCHDCLPTPKPAIARLLPNGTLDPSFGKEGVLITSPPDGESGAGVGLALEADGSIVLAGERDLFGVTASGAPNPAFGQEGVAAVEGTVAALTETPAGDMIAAGGPVGTCCGEPSEFAVRAYRPDGSLDPAWGSGGTVTIGVADIDLVTALAPGPDGTVMLAGETAFAEEGKGCRACNYQSYVARLTATGTVDPTFVAHLPEPSDPYRSVGPNAGYSSQVGAIAVLPGGGVVLAGASDAGEPLTEQATATTLSAGGSPEPGFGTAGVAADPEPLPSSTKAEAFAPGPHGSLIASFWTDGTAHAERAGLGAWTADGKLVEGYGGPAELTYAEPSTALEADGRGRLYRIEQRHYFIRRFDVDGHPDPSYGTGGVADLPPGFVTKALVVRRDGTALAVGRIANRAPMALFELTPAGRPDRHFGKGGLALIGWGKDKKATALTATFDRHGRIVLFGVFGRQTPLARLLPDGRLDPSFGHGGRVNFKPVLATEVSSVSVAGDGRIYLATSPEGGGETTLVRFRGDGVRDRSFGTGGVVRVNRAPALVRLFVSGNGLVLVSGEGQYHRIGFALRAFHLDGSIDRSFAHHGLYRGDSGVTKGLGVIGAVREPDGDIVVAGTHRPRSFGEKLELLRFR
jgi:uncharacterized delta-60 repeat protein